MLIPSIKHYTFGEDLGSTELEDGVAAPLGYLYDRPFCNAVLATVMNVTTGGSHKLVSFDAETNDNDTMHSLVTNPNRITFATAGAYLIGGQARFAAAATGRVEVMIRTMANGSAAGGTELIRGVAANSDGGATINWSRPGTFGVSNYIECFVFQNSGGTIQLLSGNESSFMWARQITI